MSARTERQVVVVFDVTAADRLEAARAVIGLINGTRERYVSHTAGQIESWWFPEADLKALDGNDNASMHLEHDDPPLDVFVEDDAEDTPTVWLATDDPERPIALLTPDNLGRRGRELLWDHIVRGLPTSAPAGAQ